MGGLQTLSFYQLSGAQLGKDRELKFDPCALTYFGDGEYLLLGGSDKKVTMWTKEGVFLSVVAERDDWVWAVGARPKQKYLVWLFWSDSVRCYPPFYCFFHHGIVN